MLTIAGPSLSGRSDYHDLDNCVKVIAIGLLEYIQCTAGLMLGHIIGPLDMGKRSSCLTSLCARMLCPGLHVCISRSTACYQACSMYRR